MDCWVLSGSVRCWCQIILGSATSCMNIAGLAAAGDAGESQDSYFVGSDSER